MIKLKKKKFKNLILKVDAYRKYIRSVNFINNYKKKICLVCYSISFGGYSLNLLKDYFSYKNYEIYNYKDNFEFLNLNSKIQNYLYNYKFHNFYKKSIFFFFNDFNEVYLFCYRIKKLTLSPYFFYPLFLVTPRSNTILSYSLLTTYFQNYKYKYYQNSFFYYIYINIIKKAILVIFIFIVLKISS